jgi:hypothetical protein
MNLDVAGSIASLIGLAISCYVASVALTVRRYFFRTNRIPILLSEITEYRSILGLTIYGTKDVNINIPQGHASCVADLKSLKSKVRRRDRAPIREAIKLLETVKPVIPRNQAYNVHAKLELIETTIRNWLSDTSIGENQ